MLRSLSLPVIPRATWDDHRPIGPQRPVLPPTVPQVQRVWRRIIRALAFKRPPQLHHEEERPGGRYQYTALESQQSSGPQQERLQLQRKAREHAHNACLAYLQSSNRYTLLHHLDDIGSRVDKQWFVVRDSSVKTERLLTLVPRSTNCVIQCHPGTRTVILDLFLALQHPYIYPVLDLDFRDSFIIVVLPFNSKGSLKDLIYKSRWQDCWSRKYGGRGVGLPVWQVQRLGRQILEAVVFLREKGFPLMSHLHSGNIILQNGVARLSGLENSLLGHNSRVHPLVWGLAKGEQDVVDTVCFGHILFEMCAGYELTSPQLSATQLLDIHDYPQVMQILSSIFNPPDGRFPTVEELLMCDFFRNIDLREMRSAPLPQMFQVRLTSAAINLLKEIKKHQSSKRPRRCHSVSAVDEDLPPPRERRNEPSIIGADSSTTWQTTALRARQQH